MPPSTTQENAASEETAESDESLSHSFPSMLFLILQGGSFSHQNGRQFALGNRSKAAVTSLKLRINKLAAEEGSKEREEEVFGGNYVFLQLPSN